MRRASFPETTAFIMGLVTALRMMGEDTREAVDEFMDASMSNGMRNADLSAIIDALVCAIGEAAEARFGSAVLSIEHATKIVEGTIKEKEK